MMTRALAQSSLAVLMLVTPLGPLGCSHRATTQPAVPGAVPAHVAAAHAAHPASRAAKDRPLKTREQVMDRHRALVAGLGTTLGLGIVGLATLLVHATLAHPNSPVEPRGMPTAMAAIGGVMSTGFLAAIPFGVALERHRWRYPEMFDRRRTTARAPLPPVNTRLQVQGAMPIAGPIGQVEGPAEATQPSTRPLPAM